VVGTAGFTIYNCVKMMTHIETKFLIEMAPV
jgi:hypothetical protein